VLLAFIGVVLFTVVIVWSFAIVRKKLKYEQWYLVHLLLYAAIILSFLHQIQRGDFNDQRVVAYWVGLTMVTAGIIGLWRFGRPVWFFLYHRFRVHSVVQETPDTWSIYITGRNLQKFKFHAGQHASLRFFNSLWWQAHPFSFSATYNSHWIRFTIKQLGDFTNTIHSIQPGTSVLVDGPLGTFTLARRKTNKPLFIAGGIGITPLRAMIEEWIRTGEKAILLYGVKTVDDIALRKEFAEMERGGGLQVVYVLGAPLPGYESGFIDRALLVRLVPDFYDRDVFLCGPPLMMKAVTASLQGLGLPKGRIHFEEFSL
jgi:predicted ferric reductase